MWRLHVICVKGGDGGAGLGWAGLRCIGWMAEGMDDSAAEVGMSSNLCWLCSTSCRGSGERGKWLHAWRYHLPCCRWRCTALGTRDE
jgi:hypothetical protein